MKQIFRSRSNYPVTIPAPSGQAKRPKLTRGVDADGNRTLVVSGYDDLIELVNLAAEGVTVADLIRRSERGEDTLHKDAIQSYVDLSNAPKSLLEAEMSILNARSEFEKLPLEVRQSYDNNLSKWLKSIDDGSFVKSTIEKLRAEEDYRSLAKDRSSKAAVFTQEQENRLKELISGGNNNA